jgi:hypothetical protein
LKRTKSPESQLEEFFAKYTPEIAGLGKASLLKMRKLLPGAVEMVYDNYNALVIGFAGGERPSEAMLSIALYPRWVNLYFLHGKGLRDPAKLLQGRGNQVRFIRIASAGMFDEPCLIDLLHEALERAAAPIDPTAKRRVVIRAMAEKQRPRRPAK